MTRFVLDESFERQVLHWIVEVEGCPMACRLGFLEQRVPIGMHAINGRDLARRKEEVIACATSLLGFWAFPSVSSRFGTSSGTRLVANEIAAFHAHAPRPWSAIRVAMFGRGVATRTLTRALPATREAAAVASS